MKNKISHLRDHMFAQLERLGQEGITPEILQLEIERAKAISEIGKVVIDTAKTEIMYYKVKETSLDILSNNFIEDPETQLNKIERPPAVYDNSGHLSTVEKYT